MTSENPIAKFFTGNISRKAMLTVLLPAVLIVLFSSLLISNLLFPTVYDWRFMVISALLDAGDNPLGQYFFSIGMTIAGFMMIPMLGYYNRKLGKICKGTTRVGTFFFLLGIIGLISVGTIGQVIHSIDKFHEILAGVGFIGLVFSAFFYGFSIMKDSSKGAKQFNMKLWMIIAVILWIPVIGMAGSAVYLEVVDTGLGWVSLDWITEGGSPLLSFALWEWVLFVAVIAYMILLAVLVPQEITPLVKEKRKVEAKKDGV